MKTSLSRKKGLILEYELKNASRCNSQLKNPKKRVQIKPKLEEGLGIQEGQWALSKCRLAQIQGLAREPSD